MKNVLVVSLGLSLGALSLACAASDDVTEPDMEAGSSEATETETGEATETETGEADDEEGDGEEVKVGYEILQVVSPTQIITWLGETVSQEAFDAIELPGGWFKNQPREGESDRTTFAKSPDAAQDGEFTIEDHFGHSWRHVATIIETGIPLDDEGLLTANRIVKFHTVEFDAGRTLTLIVSPEGDPYIRISRDAFRTQEIPSIPASWTLVEHLVPEDLSIRLPDETINIRADNEDSFQGPVAPDLVGL
jgi:hypothetical protein